VIDLPGLLWAPAVALTAAWWAELIGLPVAWFRLKRTSVWRKRPPQVRRIALLKDFIDVPIFGAMLFGAIVGLATWLGAIFA
jgi:hypothetical protein